MYRELSPETTALWAKKSREKQYGWLPLPVHMSDCADIASYVWHQWLSQQSRNIVVSSLFHNENIFHISLEEDDEAHKLLRFLGACHDLGKATPVFQIKKSFHYSTELDEAIFNNLSVHELFDSDTTKIEFSNVRNIPHAMASQALLKQAGASKNIAAILGAHHGKPSSREDYRIVNSETYPECFFVAKHEEKWKIVQQDIINFALKLSSFKELSELPSPNLQGQVLLTGLVIMIDWIASNENYFPYLNILEKDWSNHWTADECLKRSQKAWQLFDATSPWIPYKEWDRQEIFNDRFGTDNSIFKPRAMQKKVWEIAGNLEEPGIMIIEAPMGEGKTEAALIAAEIFAEKKGCSGIYFALPTQATTDGLFPRIKTWIENLNDESTHSIVLAHGKAQFNDEYGYLQKNDANINQFEEKDSTLIIHQWFTGRKTSLLSDFAVGTIDQLLMMALKQKHIMLRHVGIAEKVVIIDECHAYDAYMSQYLERVLNWLGAYGVPVILLSATLPVNTRQRLIRAYLNIDEYSKKLTSGDWETSREYPLISYTCGEAITTSTASPRPKETKVEIKYIQEDQFVENLKEKLVGGGCVGVIVNTIKRAQTFSRILAGVFGDNTVQTLHSQFISTDRIEIEKSIIHELGPPETAERPDIRIIVGTQVLEQSLNIDFDLLITDLSPMDLLLQRMGRLHRFDKTKRPLPLLKAECWIFRSADDKDFDEGSKFIYGAYLLKRTQAFLRNEIFLPTDIPDLVQCTYDDSLPLLDEPLDYSENRTKHFNLIKKKQGKAMDYRIAAPSRDYRSSILGWLDTSLSDSAGEAAVRDTNPSIDVIILFMTDDEDIYYFYNKKGERTTINRHRTPEYYTSQELAQHRLNLPYAFCYPEKIDETLEELEQINKQLFFKLLESVWLHGELLLPIDPHGIISIAGYKLRYSKKEGLLYEKEGENHE